MKSSKETIWHFTCEKCLGWWSVASHDKWKPKNLYCTHCGEKQKIVSCQDIE